MRAEVGRTQHRQSWCRVGLVKARIENGVICGVSLRVALPPLSRQADSSPQAGEQFKLRHYYLLFVHNTSVGYIRFESSSACRGGVT